MRIDTVFLKDFPPFEDQEINFPKLEIASNKAEIHLLTGENGTGKTRLLALLAAACGNSTELMSRLIERPLCRVIAEGEDQIQLCFFEKDSLHAQCYKGETASNFIKQYYAIPEKFGPAHQNIPLHHVNISFLFENSSKTTAFAFRGMARVSDPQKIEALSAVNLGKKTDHLLFDRADKKEDEWLGQCMVNIKMKAAIFLASGPVNAEDRSLRMAQRLEATISDITGREFLYRIDNQPKLALRVRWGGVPMWLKQLPDGLRSIIGWLVACVTKLDGLFPEEENPLDLPIVVLLDEPENHLHPAWQRRILPAAQKLLPNAQFFVATHSPFIISSVNENGWIHVLRADKEGKVTAEKARPCSKGDTYLDVVEDVLGIHEWYDPETEALLAKFRESRDKAKVSRDPNQIEDMKSLATAIASRSNSLSDLMARELQQFNRQLSAPLAETIAK